MTKVAIMITSCDAYKECWAPMIYSLDKYWPDCKYPRYIVSNYEEDSTIPKTGFIKVGDDERSWCTLAGRGLDAIDAEFIIFFQEDYWLDKYVDNDAIESHVEYMDENELDYLKITKDVLRDKLRIGDSDYCWNPINIRYSFNTAMAIWRKSAVRPLLIDGWSGWEFERRIVPYMAEHELSLKSQVLFSEACETKGLSDVEEGAIIRGVWTESAVNFLKENGFEDLICKREIIGPVTRWLYKHSPNNQSVFRYPFWGALKILKLLKVNW